MNAKWRIVTVAGIGIGALVAAGCATMASDAEISQRALAMMKSGFREAGQAKLDRLDQDEVQATCSRYESHDKMPKEVAERIEKSQLSTIKYPADGKLEVLPPNRPGTNIPGCWPRPPSGSPACPASTAPP